MLKKVNFCDFTLNSGHHFLILLHFQWAMRQAAEVENFMTSVERVLEFQKVESEGHRLFTKPEQNLPGNWPTSGDILFQNVCLRYASTDPPVLKKLNFYVESGEKV